jgi:hypothetical protein
MLVVSSKKEEVEADRWVILKSTSCAGVLSKHYRQLFKLNRSVIGANFAQFGFRHLFPTPQLRNSL